MIDLNIIHYITHIAVGCHYPKVVPFPQGIEKKSFQSHSSKSVHRYGRYKYVSRGRLNRKKGWVYVLAEPVDKIARTTEMELWYKDNHSGQWLTHGKIIHINSNNYGLTSTIINLKELGLYTSTYGLCTRWLKLKPVNWHIGPSMRVTVYGKTALEAKCLCTNLVHIDKHACKSQLLEEEKEDQDVNIYEEIRYIVTPAKNANNWKLDGAVRSYKDSYNMISPAKKKRQLLEWIDMY